MRNSIRQTLAALLLLGGSLFGSTSVIADPVVPGEEHCVVNVRTDDVLNLRRGPSAQSGIVTRKNYGYCGVMITGSCKGDWCPVEDGHNAGWAHRHYLSMVSPAMYCVTGVARNDVLNLRAYPSPNSRILTGLGPRQCGIAFLPYATRGWQKVRADGWQGWVNRSYLSGQ
ncbi:MAG TPA: SH3 domain-containing protein [Devosia sp.]|jgi:SH3-like domain-containing protein|nr:SH3 domain-containing protein [Devosia sp.]